MTRKTSRERIIDAALAEFDQSGYEAATVAAICDRARVSNGSFFHAFPSKDAVAGAVFLSALDAYHAALTGAVAGEVSARDGVAALVTAHLRWVIDHRTQARFMFVHAPGAHMAAIRDAQASSNEEFRARLARWYEPQMKRGALAAVAPELLISQIIGPAQMVCRAWLAGRSRSKPDAHLPDLIACAVRAVVTGAAQSE
ncbi:Transcriptional regulatory protein [Bradyrhizobium sp. ORS 375]|uniref:TetR/AcrR family transcriptional regulator n=1 Tax=Bradyrhizobium sp. (strain ORS 375) TaxID=566679 RepID=UPI0002408BD2|nr:TetR/AcrR family transcriptional regulator [Bradyrhizobium sp. ORS 375]CCD96934.1 Transcriptional regulatory protein [Bradyrhizobium sp. ORS 375]